MRGRKKNIVAMAEASSQPAMLPWGDNEMAPPTYTESLAETVKSQSELKEEEAIMEDGDGKEGGSNGDEEGERPKLAEGFYEIETVRKKRVRKGEVQYLIKWRGWPETANTWEPVKNLQECLEYIDDFEESLHSGKHKSTRGRKLKYKATTPSQPTKNQRISPAATNYNNVSVVKFGITEEPVPMGSLSDAFPTKERSKHENNEVRIFIRRVEENKEQNEIRVSVVARNEGDVDKLKSHDQEKNGVKMQDPMNEFPIVDSLEQSQSGRCTGAKRRKLGSVKRFKQDPSSVPNDELKVSYNKSGGSDLGIKSLFENSTAVATITEIVRPISYSSTTIDSVNDVSVGFIAKRSDGKEVIVDNKFLKVNYPLVLIKFYEQHLRYSPTA